MLDIYPVLLTKIELTDTDMTTQGETFDSTLFPAWDYNTYLSTLKLDLVIDLVIDLGTDIGRAIGFLCDIGRVLRNSQSTVSEYFLEQLLTYPELESFIPTTLLAQVLIPE